MPSGATIAEMPLVAATDDGAAVLDRAQPAHRQLLGALVGVAERRVVGLHDEHAGAAVDDVARPGRRRRPRSRSRRRAGRRRCPGRPGVVPAAKSRGRRSTLSLKKRKKPRAGTYSAERHRVPLDVGRRPGPVAGSQTIAVLLHDAGPGPSTTAPTRIGAPIAAAARSICRGGVGVAVRVDVGAVLRPEHEVGLRLRARRATSAASSQGLAARGCRARPAAGR